MCKTKLKTITKGRFQTRPSRQQTISKAESGTDFMLQKFKEAKETETRKEYKIAFEKRGGIWYQIRQRNDEVGDTRKQTLVPKSLREQVMEEAHDSLGVKDTKGKMQTNFFWPGLHNDVTSFCQSCDVCQKIVPRESVPLALLGDMPLIDQSFKRVAIDLVGPIASASDKVHRHVVALVDYATRYPEAVPLKNIDSEMVTEALLDMYSRVGISEKVLSDHGTQFISNCMKEVSRCCPSDD